LDPLAHTLVGATLGEAGLKQLAPRAGFVLVVAANLPDLDAAATLLGPDASFALRRGWTHGVLAMALLPLLLVGVLVWLDSRRGSAARLRDPTHRWRLLGLAYLGVLSHPFLDWLNTYGIRLLMPFDDRWFYGDALVVVDPWMWLLAGAAAVAAHAASFRTRLAWAALGLGTSALVWVAPGVPGWARITWLAGVGAIAALCLLRPAPRALARVAQGCLLALGLYVAVMVGLSRSTRSVAAEWLSERESGAEVLVVNPRPGDPSRRDVVAATPDAHLFVRVSGLTASTLRPPVDRTGDEAVIRAALEAPQIAGFRAWLRVPSYEVRETEEGYAVTIRDLRYATPDGVGFGVTTVHLDRELRPLAAERVPGPYGR